MVTLAIVLSLVLPKKYKAEASVVIDIKPDPVSNVVLDIQNPVLMSTQADIIQSERVAKLVISTLHLDDNPQIRAQWQDDTDGQGDLDSWLATLLLKKLEIKPSHDSNVIAIDYAAGDPKFAAIMANAFVQAYIDTSIQLRVDAARQYNGFFAQRITEARGQLERAQNKLSAFQKDHGIVAGDERLDVETARLSELSSQLVMVQALASESSSRQAQASTGNEDRLTEAQNSPVVANLKIDLSRAEASLQELNTRLGHNNPQVVQAQANVNELKARVDQETKRVASGLTVNAKANASRVADVKAALDAQRAKVLRVKDERDQMAVLQRDVENLQHNYDSLSSRQSQSNLESQIKQSEVNVLTVASPPADPAFPRLLLNVVAATVLGIFAAMAAVVMRETGDRRVRFDADFAQFGLPLLGTIPAMAYAGAGAPSRSSPWARVKSAFSRRAKRRVA
jgi:chain length determinant protein EpsF